MNSIENKSLSRIYENKRGWVFTPKDFSDIGSRSAIDVALHRLENKSTIRRISRGVYEYPRYSKLLNRQLSPDIHKVALAISRKFGWRIQASGATALNLLGLSTQIPAQYVYISDGPSRSYKIGTIQLEFKGKALKTTNLATEEGALIVQALEQLGKKRLDDNTIRIIRRWLPRSKRKKVLRDCKNVSSWTYEAIKQICKEDG